MSRWKHAWTNGRVLKETIKRLEKCGRKMGIWGTLAFKTHMLSGALVGQHGGFRIKINKWIAR